MTTYISLIYIIEIEFAHDNILQMSDVSQSVHTGMIFLLELFDRQVYNRYYITSRKQQGLALCQPYLYCAKFCV